MKHSTTYESFHNYQIKDVPSESLKILVTAFIESAALTLGCKSTKADVDRVCEFMASNQFNFLPVEIAASAFGRGSLGKLKNDKTTLSPRNIYDWLSDISQEYRQGLEHQERDNRLSANNIRFRDFHNYPFGKACCWKIDHVPEEQWDNVPLKEVAELIGKGILPTLEYFGI